jgi:flagellar motor switch protein FliM/N
MSESRPYFLLGGRRLAALNERVRLALEAVAREWFAQPHALQLIAVTPAESTAAELRTCRLRYLARDGDAWLGYIAPDFACVKLAEIWLGCAIPAPGPLVETLEREFCLELFGQLRGTHGGAAIFVGNDSSGLPDSALRAGAGTAIVEVDIDGIPLTLVVPAQVWPDLLDVPVGASTRPLSEVATALTASRIHVEARLPAVQLPLSEVSSLALGDFVDLQLDLTGAVRIVSNELPLALEAVLGKRDGHRAIQINNNSISTTT